VTEYVAVIEYKKTHTNTNRVLCHLFTVQGMVKVDLIHIGTVF